MVLFAESAGGHWGNERAGGAPRSVRSPMDREFLVDRFVDLFEVTGSEDSLRAQLPEQPESEGTPAGGRDFRADVEVWLAAALRRRSLTSSLES